MTRKDYIAIAAVFNKRADMARNIQNAPSRLAHYQEIAGDVADMLANDNPRFDVSRFLKACGVQS